MKIKSILLIAAVALFVFPTQAQPTNMNMELWGPANYSVSEPTGWGTVNLDNLGLPATATQEIADPGELLSSARLETKSGHDLVFGAGSGLDTLPGLISLGGSPLVGSLGTAYTLMPTSLDFIYKSNILAGDTGAVLVQLSHWSGTARVIDAQGSISLGGVVNTWTSANVPFNYFTTATPDTLTIIAMSSQALYLGTPTALPGSILWVDDFVLNVGAPPCTGPTAGFNSSSTLLNASFTNTTTGTAPFIYFWDFGDSVGTSTAQDP
ncbi:MAG TPA: hypothetical protein EYN38_05785, partial [Flavobacteriales bacterium]|nr:hypothetical protein [Flavobacteriales bacterium]